MYDTRLQRPAPPVGGDLPGGWVRYSRRAPDEIFPRRDESLIANELCAREPTELCARDVGGGVRGAVVGVFEEPPTSGRRRTAGRGPISSTPVCFFGNAINDGGKKYGSVAPETEIAKRPSSNGFSDRFVNCAPAGKRGRSTGRYASREWSAGFSIETPMSRMSLHRRRPECTGQRRVAGKRVEIYDTALRERARVRTPLPQRRFCRRVFGACFRRGVGKEFAVNVRPAVPIEHVELPVNVSPDAERSGLEPKRCTGVRPNRTNPKINPIQTTHGCVPCRW